MEARPAMTLLTSVAGTFRAHVLVARLESEGIDVQLRGATSGPYGVTMGDLARVDLYVPDDQLEDARFVLLSDEVDESLAATAGHEDLGVDPAALRARWPWWVAMFLLVMLLGVPIVGWLVRLLNP